MTDRARELVEENEHLRTQVARLEAELAQREDPRGSAEQGVLLGSAGQTPVEALMDTIQDVFWITEWDSHATVYASPAFERIWGVSLEALYADPRSWADAIHPDDRERTWAEFVQLDEQGEFDAVYRIVRQDGSLRWIHDRARPYRRPDGSITHVLGTARDITARRRAEQEAQEQAAFAERILDASALSTWISDEHGTAIRVNSACLEFFGAAAEEVLGKYNLFQDRVLLEAGLMPVIRRVFEQGEVANVVLDYDFAEVDHVDVANATHKVVNSIFTPVLGSDGRVTNVIVQTIDMTENRRAAEALARSESLHRTTIDAVQDPLHVVDRDLRLKVINKSCLGWCERLGFEGEVLGRRLTEVFGFLNDEALACYRTVLDDGQPVSAVDEFTLQGTRHISEVQVVPVREGDTVTGALTIVRDITAQREAQEQARQAQKMQAVGRLAGGMAHDFNNLLSGIMGFASLLRADLGVDDPHTSDVDEILGLCRRARDLTQNLLGFARMGKYRKVSLDLNETIRHVQRLLQRTMPKGIQLVVQPAQATPPTIEGDPGQLEQVLMNLCINAIDAMGERGTLTITTRVIDPDPEQGADALRVELSVADTGVGMDPEVIERAFEPFFTTKPQGKGTGLGLAMVYGTVDNHGGTVRLESVPGEGTEVTLSLPGVGAQPAPSRPRRAVPVGPRGEGTVLVVDDEVMVRRAVGRSLRLLGYRVLQAAHGVEALEIDANDPADLVVLDMAMPVMDGPETFRALRARRSDLPVLLCSGYAADSVAAELLVEPRVDFLQKPFELSVLAAAVERGLMGGEH